MRLDTPSIDDFSSSQHNHSNAAGGGTLSTYTGYTGSTGYTGPGNFTGFTGYTGPEGYSGADGPTGATGPAGYSGADGPTGPTGYTGPGNFTGYTGFTGTTGYTGPAPSGGIVWSAVTDDATFTVDTGVLANKGTLLTMALPTTCAVGKTVRIAGMNASAGWAISQAANQYIRFGAKVTTVGVGGSLASSVNYDAVELVCLVADLGFEVVSSNGNITIV